MDEPASSGRTALDIRGRTDPAGRTPIADPPPQERPDEASVERALSREFGVAARVIGYLMLWLVLAWLLFRLAVPYLWGLPIDLAPIAALIGAGLGSLALAYLGLVMVRDVLRTASTGRR